jgi:polyisoprenoid-binding protein YceI
MTSLSSSSLLALVVGAAALLLAGLTTGPAVPYRIDAGASTMTIAGTSTLHDWECAVEDVGGRLQVQPAAEDDAAAPVSGLPSVSVQVPVEKIECGKGRMNRNLRKALDADAYPTILFSLEAATVSPLPDSAGSWFSVSATGELIVAGARRQVEVPVKGQRLDDGFRFVGEKSLKMTDFDVDPPSVMLGTINTGDEVTVRFDVVAARQ